jgi:peroxiredoxin
MWRAGAAVALTVLIAVSAGCGGSSKPDRGGFDKQQLATAQDALDILYRTSVTSIVVTNTTQDGIPVCRVHLEQAKPATFNLFIVWNPRGQFAASQTGNTFSWLTVRLREQGPDLRTWRLANVADAQSVKHAYGQTLNPPVEPCEILNNGRIQIVRSSPEIESQTRALLQLGNRTATASLAPSFALPRVDASGAVTVRWPADGVTVVSFWSASCATCSAVAAQLEDESSAWKAKGVRVIGVNEFDFLADARAFIRKNHVTYPTAHDSGRVGKRYNVDQLPETFVIDRRGYIAGRFAGVPGRAQLEAGVNRAIAQK